MQDIRKQLDEIRASGTWREERVITTPQTSRIDTTEKKNVVNLCANNYLGLSANPNLIAAAKKSYDEWGFGLSSVRFICGTQKIHKELEARIARFVGTDDAILYSSCFDANGGLFETLLGPEDAVVSDELNHASIIDGIRLCKAKRYRYKNNNMWDYLLKNGTLVDGTGRPGFRGDLAVQAGKIAAVGRLDAQNARQTLDVSGLSVTPGFIDCHAHSDFTIWANPECQSAVRQGVTTEVEGNCGSSMKALKGGK